MRGLDRSLGSRSPTRVGPPAAVFAHRLPRARFGEPMSAIKPGCLCIIVGPRIPEEYRGRIVHVLAYIGWVQVKFIDGQPGVLRDCWAVEADFLDLRRGPWTAAAVNLKPISDPDADLSESYPETLEDRLRELRAAGLNLTAMSTTRGLSQ